MIDDQPPETKYATDASNTVQVCKHSQSFIDHGSQDGVEQ